MTRRRIALLTALVIPACDVPTAAPSWEQTWVVPAQEVEVGVAELLPAGVSVNSDSSAFLTTVPATSVSMSLSAMCPSCAVLDGTVSPKPEFRDTVTSQTALSPDLVSASLSGGSFDVVLEHELNFDPLRPSADPAAPRGFVVVNVLSGGNTVAHDSISGEDRAFPAGTQLVPVLPVQPVDAANAMVVQVIVYSPAGDAVLIEESDTVGMRMSPSGVEADQATVSATAMPVAGAQTTLNFEGLDATAIERVQSGGLRVHVDNPFTVTGSLDLEFDPGSAPIDKSLPLEQGTYDDRVAFTGDELRDLLGADVVAVTTTGTVSATGGTVTITPAQSLVVDADFELVILVGGESN